MLLQIRNIDYFEKHKRQLNIIIDHEFDLLPGASYDY